MNDFNKKISRRNTESVKWDSITKTYHVDDLLPLWVADMDFLSPTGVKNAFEKYIFQGIFGYSTIPENLYQSIIDWEKEKHQVLLIKENIVFTSGVLSSLAVAIQAFTNPNDSILIHDPVYPPFSAIIENNQRKLIRSRLIEKNNKFTMNYQEMEKKMIEQKVKAIILCNPHNPGGRVWTKEELTKLSELCLKYRVLLFSDEIHQDLVFPSIPFTSMLDVNEDLNDFLITFTSATKTFNLAPIKNSMVFIKNPKLKAQFEQHLLMNQQQEINTFGLIGTQAAYETGKEWLDELLSYIERNAQIASNFFKEQLPDVGVMPFEGTYLMWLDFSAYETDDTALESTLIHKGKVVLNSGITFGPAGHAHMRLNIACPEEVLLEGLARIKKAFT
ncbi:MAG: pyridoxal phosphate-dependent aminotransferase [Enterococcus lacertideformus]|uniref:cysteine-S-conjugate beta-lyase n=1 Tax=Enterococcus lacertideformus TaxID=2771493 RepID=A0A931FD37_9ENTE|nr:pyridoxal phosphate-dependent aminotransferase [Enterococcus lacertideformus]